MVLSTKHGPIGLEVYDMVRSFITFNGIFMGCGYGLGDGSVWNKQVTIDEEEMHAIDGDE